MYRMPSPKVATVTCPQCQTIHRDVEVNYDEDGGYVDLDEQHCNEDYCTAELCSSCPQFVCEDCALTFCLEHRILTAYDVPLCPQCYEQRKAEDERELCAMCETGADRCPVRE